MCIDHSIINVTQQYCIGLSPIVDPKVQKNLNEVFSNLNKHREILNVIEEENSKSSTHISLTWKSTFLCIL